MVRKQSLLEPKMDRICPTEFGNSVPCIKLFPGIFLCHQKIIFQFITAKYEKLKMYYGEKDLMAHLFLKEILLSAHP